MTNLFKKSITSFALFSLFFGTVSVSAQRPAPIELAKTSVPITQAPFLYYFPYGKITSDVDLTNQAAKMTLTNVTTPGQTPAFEVVPDENFDIFNGDPNRLATEPTPASPVSGCPSFTGTRYPMAASFFTTSGMNNYGLQTVKNTAASSGTFRQKSTGCMAFKLKVGANAKVGDQARITFDWDAALSPNLQEAQRPEIQTGLLEVMAATTSSVSSVSSSASPSPSSSSRSSSSSAMAMMVASSSSSSPSSSSAPSSSRSSSSDPCKVGSFFGGLNAYADGVPATTTTTPSGGGTAPTTTTTTTPATTTTTTNTTNTECITKTVTTGGFGIALLVGLMAIGGGAAVMVKTRRKEVKVDIGSK